MCLAIPGKVLEIIGRKARVQYPHEQREVMVGGDNIKVGDHVMVQMGIIIKVLSESDAKLVLEAWTT